MSRKNDVKLLFNFMIELLKEEEKETKEEKVQVPVESKIESPKKLILDNKQEDYAKHILEVMKRAELMDKMRTTVNARPKIIPTDLRDEDEIAKADSEAINTYKAEKKNKNLNEIKSILTNAKDFMDELENKKPLIPSVPPSILNEQEFEKETHHFAKPTQRKSKK